MKHWNKVSIRIIICNEYYSKNYGTFMTFRALICDNVCCPFFKCRSLSWSFSLTFHIICFMSIYNYGMSLTLSFIFSAAHFFNDLLLILTMSFLGWVLWGLPVTLLKTLFNIVEAPLNKNGWTLMSVLYDDVQITQPEYKSFEIYAVSIKISMTEYHHWINDLVDHLFYM